jgi:LAO/AO transport system kinase
LRGDRVTLARAITVIESELPADAGLAEWILDGVLPHSGNSRRVGITGVPGAGKSTFIDVLGLHLIAEHGSKVAVLSVDPSSPVSGGSILGDKTRMERLSNEPNAYIRPSPTRGHLGGVTRRTRETILLCEAAGFRDILVETVGVGQSETAVRSMTDFFLVLMIPGAGDELQGIKRGIIEMLDGMVINKADGDNLRRAERARSEYASALHLFPVNPDGWTPRVLTCSALHNTGIAAVWQMVLEHSEHQKSRGAWELRRRRQALDWMKELISLGLRDLFEQHSAIQERLPVLEDAVRRGETSSLSAARDLLNIFMNRERS